MGTTINTNFGNSVRLDTSVGSTTVSNGKATKKVDVKVHYEDTNGYFADSFQITANVTGLMNQRNLLTGQSQGWQQATGVTLTETAPGSGIYEGDAEIDLDNDGTTTEDLNQVEAYVWSPDTDDGAVDDDGDGPTSDGDVDNQYVVDDPVTGPDAPAPTGLAALPKGTYNVPINDHGVTGSLTLTKNDSGTQGMLTFAGSPFGPARPVPVNIGADGALSFDRDSRYDDGVGGATEVDGFEVVGSGKVTFDGKQLQASMSFDSKQWGKIQDSPWQVMMQEHFDMGGVDPINGPQPTWTTNQIQLYEGYNTNTGRYATIVSNGQQSFISINGNTDPTKGILIQPDGSFSGVDGQETLSGTYVNGQLNCTLVRNGVTHVYRSNWA